jgi:hypothetical protein
MRRLALLLAAGAALGSVTGCCHILGSNLVMGKCDCDVNSHFYNYYLPCGNSKVTPATAHGHGGEPLPLGPSAVEPGADKAPKLMPEAKPDGKPEVKPEIKPELSPEPKPVESKKGL